ncbi:MAG: polysaccharide biosynthesis tyrosine autokinase [Clostridia bacterium]|nr:polysaccharide biosynthesis tyrosine autokinase [Clostridia bacterium]
MSNKKITSETNDAASSVEIKVLLSDLWRGIIKFGWVALVLAVLFSGVEFYRTYIRFVPEYTVSATFTVQTENKSLTGTGGVSAYSFYYNRDTADQLATVFPYIVGNSVLKMKVCDDLGVNTMPASVTAQCVTGTNMVTLTARGGDPALTYNTLLSVIDNYSSVADYIIGRTKLLMISEPVLPQTPSNKMAWQSSVLTAAVIGLLVGIAWIMIYAIIRKTIRTKEDIRNILNQHCIGILPQVIFKKYRRKINTDIILTNPLIGSGFLESLRLLRTAVQNSLGKNEKALVITSTAPNEGKSIVTTNLAAIFAKSEKKVLVIDCDLRNSGIASIINADDLKPVATEDGTEYSVCAVETLGFDLLRINSSAPQKFLRTAEIRDMINHFKQRYDLILIDTPPCGIISDAAIIAGAADGILYVIREDAVMQNAIRSGINTLLETDTKFLGCILNGAASGIGSYGGHYNYGGYYRYRRYGYDYGSKKGRRKGKHYGS